MSTISTERFAEQFYRHYGVYPHRNQQDYDVAGTRISLRYRKIGGEWATGLYADASNTPWYKRWFLFFDKQAQQQREQALIYLLLQYHYGHPDLQPHCKEYIEKLHVQVSPFSASRSLASIHLGYPDFFARCFAWLQDKFSRKEKAVQERSLVLRPQNEEPLSEEEKAFDMASEQLEQHWDILEQAEKELQKLLQRCTDSVEQPRDELENFARQFKETFKSSALYLHPDKFPCVEREADASAILEGFVNLKKNVDSAVAAANKKDTQGLQRLARVSVIPELVAKFNAMIAEAEKEEQLQQQPVAELQRPEATVWLAKQQTTTKPSAQQDTVLPLFAAGQCSDKPINKDPQAVSLGSEGTAVPLKQHNEPREKVTNIQQQCENATSTVRGAHR